MFLLLKENVGIVIVIVEIFTIALTLTSFFRNFKWKLLTHFRLNFSFYTLRKPEVIRDYRKGKLT